MINYYQYQYLLYQNMLRNWLMAQNSLYSNARLMPNVPMMKPIVKQSVLPLKNKANAVTKKPIVKVANPLLSQKEEFTAKNLDTATLDKITELYGLNIDDIYELSPGQEWMFEEAQVVTSTFFIQSLLKIVGKINIAAFRKTLDKVVNKHNGLRTAFVHTGLKKPYQVVLKSRQAELLLRDFSQYAESEISDLLDQQMLAERRRGFDLERDILIRVAIYKLDEKSSAVLISMPHIIFDGVSGVIFFKDLFVDYAFNESGKTVKEIVPSQYTNYIDWLATVDKAKEQQYWTELLANLPELKIIPGYKQSSLEFVKASSAIVFDEEICQKIRMIQAKAKATLNNVIQAAWGVMLQKIYQTDDITIGAISSGREGAVKNVNNILGGMVNAIPVRIKSGDSLLFVDLVSEVREQFFMSMENAQCSPNEIKKWLGRTSPLFDHLLNFHNFSGAAEMRNAPDLPGISLVGMEGFDYLAADLCVYLSMQQDKLQAAFSYNANTLSIAKIKLLQDNFVSVIKQITDNPNISISEIKTDAINKFNELNNNEEFEFSQTVGKLKEMRLFTGLNDDILRKILRMAKIRTYTVNDRIIKIDSKPQQFMVVMNGFAEVAIRSLEGWLSTVRIVKTGDIIGMDTIIDEEKSYWEVSALSDNVEVLALDRYIMLDLLNKYAELKINLLRLTHDQLKTVTSLWVNAE